MAKPNYSFEKRQRELGKKQKKEEKRLRKTPANNEFAESATTEEATPLAPSDSPAPTQ